MYDLFKLDVSADSNNGNVTVKGVDLFEPGSSRPMIIYRLDTGDETSEFSELVEMALAVGSPDDLKVFLLECLQALANRRSLKVSTMPNDETIGSNDSRHFIYLFVADQTSLRERGHRDEDAAA